VGAGDGREPASASTVEGSGDGDVDDDSVPSEVNEAVEPLVDPAPSPEATASAFRDVVDAAVRASGVTIGGSNVYLNDCPILSLADRVPAIRQRLWPMAQTATAPDGEVFDAFTRWSDRWGRRVECGTIDGAGEQSVVVAAYLDTEVLSAVLADDFPDQMAVPAQSGPQGEIREVCPHSDSCSAFWFSDGDELVVELKVNGWEDPPATGSLAAALAEIVNDLLR
jgi:hypothetical protein